MKNKILSIFIIIFTIITINCFRLSSYAVANENCELTIVADKNEIKKGEEVTFTIKTSNIEGINGIIMFNTIIEFNQNEFSFADSDGIVSAQGWANFERIENSVTFCRQDLLPSKDDQEIGKIKLVANKDITIGEKSINFNSNEFVIENAEKQEVTLNMDNIKVNTKIIDENNDGNNSEENFENNTENNDQNNSENSDENQKQNITTISSESNPDYKVKEESATEKNLPKTGIMQFSGILCVILIIIAIVAYIKYKRIS